jgi:hypothetical protein
LAHGFEAAVCTLQMSKNLNPTIEICLSLHKLTAVLTKVVNVSGLQKSPNKEGTSNDGGLSAEKLTLFFIFRN